MGVGHLGSYSFYLIKEDGEETPIVVDFNIDTNANVDGWSTEWTIPYDLVANPISLQVRC